MITFKAKTNNGEVINSALSSFTFPAGEAHTKREDRRDLEPTEIAILQADPYGMHDDLFQLAMWNNYLRSQKEDINRVLLIPYFPGARADRGIPFGLGVYAEFIDTLDLNQIILFDPHSTVTMHELAETNAILTDVYSHELLSSHYAGIVMPNIYTGIISPDKGAIDRAEAVAHSFGVPLYIAGKTRDFETGKLTGFTVETLPKYGKFLIVDDICDGGGTFLGLADKIQEFEPALLDLYVSHGVFSGGARINLPQKFRKIFTTTSYNHTQSLMPGPWINDHHEPAFARIDVIRLLLSKVN